MIKSIKHILVFLLIITIFAAIGVFTYTSGRTYFNEDIEVGNTAGNLYNGGLFSEQDGKIYFSNDEDDGSLYVMDSDCTNIRKIYDDKAVFINADSNYIYYVRANNTRDNQQGTLMMFYNTGVFRINHNGRNLKAFTGNPGAYLTLHGNNIYFQRYDAGIGLYLYKYRIDGQQEQLLVKDAVVPAGVMNNSLYYTGYSADHNINSINLSDYNQHMVYQGNYYYPIFMNEYIYYLNLDDNYNIYRMNSDGSNPVPMIKDRVSTYNITNDGRSLIYQVDDQKNNRICLYNLDTLTERTLMEGNYKQIHVTDQYVFFKDFDNTNTYVFSTSGAINISTFNPSGNASSTQ